MTEKINPAQTHRPTMYGLSLSLYENTARALVPKLKLRVGSRKY